MALDKVIDSAKLEEDLTSVANAIREKTGSTDPIAFPDGFVEQVGAIQTGGGVDKIQYWVDNIGCVGMFYKQMNIKYANVKELFSNIDTSNVTSMADMFYCCDQLGSVPLFNTSNVTNMQQMFDGCTRLNNIPLFDTGNVTNMAKMFSGCAIHCDIVIPQFDTRNVTSMYAMFYGCYCLTTVPLFNTSNVTNMQQMFDGCRSLTAVPLFDTGNVTNMAKMFSGCTVLNNIPLFDTGNVTDISRMFYNCKSLTTVPLFDMRSVTSTSYMFNGCLVLTEVWLRNIKCNLQVGSGTSYGHLLTVDSLVHLCYELRDTGSSKTLTVGSANLEKLASVYVRSIEITDGMRAEDDLIDEKLPFEVCESTDEGATLISEYIQLKNWILA